MSGFYTQGALVQTDEKTILLIDDHAELRDFLAEVLEQQGYEVITARCPDDAFRELRKEDYPDIIISDLEMPFTFGNRFFDFDYSHEVGVRTIEELQWVFPDTPIVAITALPDDIVARVTKRIPTVPVLRKPFAQTDLLEVIRTLTDPTNAAIELH